MRLVGATAGALAAGPLAVALLVMALLVAAPPVAAAADVRAGEARLPLGKANYAVAIGGLNAGSTANWVRLGQYTFATDGTVAEQHWAWSQRTRVVRTSTGNLAEGCTERDCTVLTAAGWESAAAARRMTGHYAVHRDELLVWWGDGLWERWLLRPQARGRLGGIELVDDNFGATHGFGDGSNARWDARVPAAAVAAADHTRLRHEYFLWKTDYDPRVGHTGYIDQGGGSPFWVTRWNRCADGRCLGAETNVGRAAHTVYYVSPADRAGAHRRDALWHWHTDLADALKQPCYKGNSHVKPMIQVVDDDGRFHGWVGVEASLNQTTSAGPFADDIGVFRIVG
ncbi:hypothetical protein [Actinomadura fibrosa]|uniref:Uncharacterized protein n=1 Tax=Actinomadura fibrosa TaxID=111802 RepID=A0ABW2XRX3_9ACTN|nr:hypothetical protein [Actinomadura fibrosa]